MILINLKKTKSNLKSKRTVTIFIYLTIIFFSYSFAVGRGVEYKWNGEILHPPKQGPERINDYKSSTIVLGKKRGFTTVSFERFYAQNAPRGALSLASHEEVAEKILKHSKSQGGISRFTFQMDAGLLHEKLMKSIEIIGKIVLPIIKKGK